MYLKEESNSKNIMELNHNNKTISLSDDYLFKKTKIMSCEKIKYLIQVK